ncbi:MAG: hypothetical protein U1E83_07305 [Methylotetracoccus sp.]
MSDCSEQWKLDVNDRYERAVGVVTSLSSASLVLPVLFLKDIAQINTVRSFAASLNCWAYAGWILLSFSILSGIIYYYLSAKWAKLAWGKDADIFGIGVQANCVERLLDVSYFVMMGGFLMGLAIMLTFMVTFTANT